MSLEKSEADIELKQSADYEMEGGEVVEITVHSNKVQHHDETEVGMKTDEIEDAIEVAEDVVDALDEAAEKWRRC
jgi:hypothetical protein